MFYADLHIHSRFSRATSADGCPVELAAWAQRKGLAVIGSGDFTHPAWRRELQEQLVPAEPGLFRLRPDLEQRLAARLSPLHPGAEAALCRRPDLLLGPARFLLQVEIATIYKRDGRTRKVHHVVCVPDFAAAERLAQALGRIGNLNADGRPILGLDARHLLEIALQSDPGSFLIPAHIWTPWFSALGANSGFDSVAECYGDLAPHVFALETGLSSDPPMNWRLSALDRYRLVSCSDAHSPAKLGREAAVFDAALDYFAIRRALETGAGYAGTVEFFPEEGKYHLDGHRPCGVRCAPAETRRHGGRCPVCGKPLTVGVLHRVEALADRPENAPPPPGAAPFRSFVPLPEILAEIHAVGAGSRAVAQAYEALLARLGPELPLLEFAPPEELQRAGGPRLAEALARLRAGRVVREAGYDGAYGRIRVLSEAASADEANAELLPLPPPAAEPPTPHLPPPGAAADQPSDIKTPAPTPAAPSALDAAQDAAVRHGAGPLLIVAGPGAGKTRVLAHRIARLIASGAAAPAQCLAFAFTQRAAAELAERLAALLPAADARVPVLTFHAFGYRFLREHRAALGLPPDLRIAAEPAAGSLGFDDLILRPLALLETDAALRQEYRRRFPYVFVDEFQDIDPPQYRLLRCLVPPDGNLCAIGDPDQAIYGFRGADLDSFARFAADFPAARVLTLARNYRSAGPIVRAAVQMLAPAARVRDRSLEAVIQSDVRVEIHAAASDKAEAEYVVQSIEQLVGGSSFFARDSGRATEGGATARSFADFAVLYRTAAQSDLLAEALRRSGLPFQRRAHTPLADVPALRPLLEAAARAPAPAALPAVLRDAAAALGDPSRQREAQSYLPVLEALARQSVSVADFLSALALRSDADFWDPRADRISLLTLHAAKGLEFPVVFIVGCEDGILPLRWGAQPADEAEERRLLFVGMTRARERLFLAHARRRLWRGRVQEREPSPFLRDIEDALLRRTAAEHHRAAPRRPAGEQLPLFPGD